MEVEIKSKEIKIVPIDSIQPWEMNRNKHSEAQIDRLIEIINYQGFSSPLEVDIETNDIVSGCGRFLAAKKMGMTELPVYFRSYDSYDQKYARSVSENAIASWSELDLVNIHVDLQDLELPNIDLLGIEKFEFEPDSDKLHDEKDLNIEHILEIRFKTEQDQQKMYNQLKDQNYDVRILS